MIETISNTLPPSRASPSICTSCSVYERGQDRCEQVRLVEQGQTERIPDLRLMHPLLGVLAGDVQPQRRWFGIPRLITVDCR